MIKDGRTVVVTKEGGLPVSEKLIAEDGASEYIKFFYEGSLLQQVEGYSEDELIYTDKYAYTVDNMLLDVKREFPSSGRGVISSIIFKDGLLTDYWADDNESRTYLRFDETGLIYSELETASGWRESREYTEDEFGRDVLKLVDSAGRELTTTFDDTGRTIRTSESDESGQLVETVAYEYRGELLVTMSIKTELSNERFFYTYDKEGEPDTELYQKNGIVVKKTSFEGNRRTEELYRFGTPVLRIIFEDGRRIGTEQIQE